MTVRLLFEATPIVAWPAETEPPCGKTLGGPAIVSWMGMSDTSAAKTNTIARRKRRRVGPTGMLAVLDKFFHRKVREKFSIFGFDNLTIFGSAVSSTRRLFILSKEKKNFYCNHGSNWFGKLNAVQGSRATTRRPRVAYGCSNSTTVGRKP